jgi:hypothetical protein
MNTYLSFFHRMVSPRLVMGLLILTLPLPGFAALGDSASSVLTDQAQLKASLNTVHNSSYYIHEMTLSTGTVVREYVSQHDERVFGVTWHGPFTPDLKLLLGTYFGQYSEAAKAQRQSRVGRYPLRITTAQLVVQTAGHMGDFAGRAYDPGLVPVGVDTNVIQ